MGGQILIICGFCAVWVAAAMFRPVDAQTGARNTIPETVTNCYRNFTAFNRYTRQPMHINNLIAIIRKIEKKDPNWSMRRIARTIVHRYMFDGLKFNGDAKYELQFNPVPWEGSKTDMIKEMIPISSNDIIPQGYLDNDELCALHWMLSHSTNTTIRDEELNPNYNVGNGYNYNSPNSGYGNPRSGNEPLNSGGISNGGYNYNGNGNSGNMRRSRRSITDGEEELLKNNPTEMESENSNTNIESGDAKEQPQVVTKQDQSPSNDSPSPAQVLGRSASMPGIPSDADDTKFARQVISNPQKSQRPIETGVIYTDWGAVSGGRLMAGIAAGLESSNFPLSGNPYINQNPDPFGSGSNPNYNSGSNPNYNSGSNSNYNSGNSYSGSRYPGRKRRQALNGPPLLSDLNSLHAATIAGDVGQAAIRNGKYDGRNLPVPSGVWNDTICPREYILNPISNNPDSYYSENKAYTFMTEAEIRGGMDGLILGRNIKTWDAEGMKLSDILDGYYSETGVTGDLNFKACSRVSLFNSVDVNEIEIQARAFAYQFNNRTSSIPPQQINDNPNLLLIQPVNEAFNKMRGVSSSSDSTQICRQLQTNSDDDSTKFVPVKNRMYVVLDHTATFDEIVAQKRFIAKLAYEINVSPKGSRLGVMDGSSGQLIINPNDTDTASILACRIISLPTQIKNQDMVRVLQGFKAEMERVRPEEERLNIESDLGTVILFLVQGRKPDENQKSEVKKLSQEISDKFGDVRILFTSSKYQEGDFDGIALNHKNDFIRIQSGQNLSDSAFDFTKIMKTKTQGRLGYIKCNANKFDQKEEHLVATNFLMQKGTIQYFKISPDYFYSSKYLRLRFTSDSGKVRVCESRSNEFPSERNRDSASCQVTTKNYIIPGSSDADVEFTYSKPCGKHGNRNGCQPIYLSVTPTEVSPTTIGCNVQDENCIPQDHTKVTFTHFDMRCNGSVGLLLSLPMALVALMISIMFWKY